MFRRSILIGSSIREPSCVSFCPFPNQHRQLQWLTAAILPHYYLRGPIVTAQTMQSTIRVRTSDNGGSPSESNRGLVENSTMQECWRHATTCVMSFQAFTILVFVVQYLIFLKGGLQFRKKWLLQNRLLYASIFNVLIVLKSQDGVRFSAAFQRVSCAPYLFCLFYSDSVFNFLSSIGINDSHNDHSQWW